jgi:hypothetical protein
MNVKEVRVLGTNLKLREYEYLIKLAAPKMHHSFDLAVQIPN